MLLESLTVNLGAAMANAVAKVWLGDTPILEGAANGLTETLKKKLLDFEARHAAEKLMQDLQFGVAKRLERAISIEFPVLQPNDGNAAVNAVARILGDRRFPQQMVIANLDPVLLFKQLVEIHKKPLERLGGDAGRVAEMLLRESCAYAINVADKLPAFNQAATQEILKRTTELMADMNRVLDGIEAVRRNSIGVEEANFEVDYRRTIIQKLDRVQLFGVRLTGGGAREWPLSLAYVTLSSRQKFAEHATDVHSCLVDRQYVLIRGEAGSGKTTLLHWIAVRAGARDFPPALSSWNSRTPFIVRLREFSSKQKSLPPPECLLESIAPNLSGAMPSLWAHQALRQGALLLVDGVDEIPEARRGELEDWLADMQAVFPNCLIAVTSRPAALDADRGRGTLSQRLANLGFDELTLEPMTLRQSTLLVSQWHDAAGRDVAMESDRLKLQSYSDALKRSLRASPAVRNLAANPLLCALICALNWDRKQHMPQDRMELYRLAIDMLIDGRDLDRGIGPVGLQGLDKPAKEELLSAVAYWMLRNGYAEASFEDVAEQLEEPLGRLSSVPHEPHEVLRELLERSGVLREPSHGVVDFIHRTFLEFLAARCAVDSADFGLLVERASKDSWREPVVFAAGHSRGKVRDRLVSDLLKKPWLRLGARSTEADITAACCLETVGGSLNPLLLHQLQDRAKRLFPPADAATARLLAPTAALDPSLLVGHRDLGAGVAAACIRCAAIVAGTGMIEVIEHYADIDSPEVQAEILAAWTAFDEQEYMARVVQRQPWSEFQVPDSSNREDFFWYLLVLSTTGDAGAEAAALQGTLAAFSTERHISLETLNLGDAQRIARIKSLLSLAILRLSDPEALRYVSGSKLKALSISALGSSADLYQLVANIRSLESVTITSPFPETPSRTVDWSVDLRPLNALPCLQALRIENLNCQWLTLPTPPKLTSLSLVGVDITKIQQLSDYWGQVNLRSINIECEGLGLLSLLLRSADYAECISIRMIDSMAPLVMDLPIGTKELELRNFSEVVIHNLSQLNQLKRIKLANVRFLSGGRQLAKLSSLSEIEILGSLPSSCEYLAHGSIADGRIRVIGIDHAQADATVSAASLDESAGT